MLNSFRHKLAKAIKNSDGNNKLKKKKRFLAVFSGLLLAVLVLGVNVYAWFIYITQADLSLELSVVKWVVTFSNGMEETNKIDVIVDDAYPGMNTFTKTVEITNSGDMDGKFGYKFKSLKLFGMELVNTNDTNEIIADKLFNSYPFRLSFVADKTFIPIGDTITFIVNVDWDYENSTQYFKCEEYHNFDPSLKYFVKDGTSFNEVAISNESEFETLKNTLYMDKDSADTYFGVRCGDYKNTTGNSCIEAHIELLVEQDLES